MHVRPVPGRLVRDPATMLVLPPEGLAVSDTPFWRRRIAEGDVELVQPSPAQE